MDDLQVVGGIKKLNNKNYKTWATCMESYLQGQDLWEVVSGEATQPAAEEGASGEATQPAAEEGASGEATQSAAEGDRQNWKMKVGKAMFALKITVEEEMLEYIRDAKTPKEAWDTFVTLFSRKNDARLQLLENELLSMAQRDMTIAQYFHKVKLICREISELDPPAIGETRIKRIIIHGLRPEYRGFIAAVQGWPTQPSLVEFENLLAGQEAMAKQMGGVSLKGEEKALYTNLPYEQRILVGCIAVIWVAIILALFLLAVAYGPIAIETLNYTRVSVGGLFILTVGGLLILIVSSGVLRARYWFRGPYFIQ